MRIFFFIITLLISLRTNSQVINHTIYFDSDRSEISSESKKQIDSLVSVLKSAQSYSIVIWAYCDSDGSTDYNILLSQRRAKTISDALILNKIDPARISQNALGELEPMADNTTEKGKAKNRRAQLAIVYQMQKAKSVKNIQKESSESMVISKESVSKENTSGLSSGKLEVGQTLILKNLNFEGGTAVLLPESEPTLKELLKVMQDNPDLEIEIGGHVCCDDDMPLSVWRAQRVFNYLANYRINESRMSFKGYSHDKPIAVEYNEEGRKANRRVEITILKTN
jgi:outer membrane protein OmpA-like peptidoglycan-associated protein